MTGNLEFHELSALPIIELNKDAPSHLAILIKLPTLPPYKVLLHTKCGFEKCACKDVWLRSGLVMDHSILALNLINLFVLRI